MVKSIDTLIGDIQGLFNGAELVNVAQFGSSLAETVDRRFREHLLERQPTLRMSNIGRPLRQLWYDLKGFKTEALSAETKFKFLYGDLLEELVIFLAKETGHVVRLEQETVNVDGVVGHIDCFIDDVLVDVKSCSSRSFDKLATGDIAADDPFGYMFQLAGYSCHYGWVDSAFLPVDKVLGKLALRRFSGAELKRAYDVRGRIETIRQAIAGDVPPERCYELVPVSKGDKSGSLVLPVGCSYCGHRETCYADSNGGQGLRTFYYSYGPKYFAKVGTLPRVLEKDVFPTRS